MFSDIPGYILRIWVPGPPPSGCMGAQPHPSPCPSAPALPPHTTTTPARRVGEVATGDKEPPTLRHVGATAFPCSVFTPWKLLWFVWIYKWKDYCWNSLSLPISQLCFYPDRLCSFLGNEHTNKVLQMY